MEQQCAVMGEGTKHMEHVDERMSLSNPEQKTAASHSPSFRLYGDLLGCLFLDEDLRMTEVTSLACSCLE